MQSKSALSQHLLLDTSGMRLLLSRVSDQRGKIARMIAKGEIIGLRRGLYATRATQGWHIVPTLGGPNHRKPPPRLVPRDPMNSGA